MTEKLNNDKQCARKNKGYENNGEGYPAKRPGDKRFGRKNKERPVSFIYQQSLGDVCFSFEADKFLFSAFLRIHFSPLQYILLIFKGHHRSIPVGNEYFPVARILNFPGNGTQNTKVQIDGENTIGKGNRIADRGFETRGGDK